MQPNLSSNNFIELCVCWCLWLFGTFLDKIYSLPYSIYTATESFLANWEGVIFHALQETSFVVAIIVGIVNLLRNFGFDVNLKKRWFKRKK